MEIVIPIIIVLGIIIFFIFASKSGAKKNKERERRMASSTHGKAKILACSPAGLSGTGAGGRYQGYTFTLEVADGFQQAYKTDVIWEVYPMGTPKIQTGMEVDVRIDAEDKMIVYPAIDGIQFSWSGLMMIMAKKIK
jgi:hypothetical protein